MELDPRWEIEIWEGIYESHVQQIICQFVKPGITFYDVGAGIGFYTLGAARFGATVVAFEPDPNNGATLQRHIQLNHDALFGKVFVEGKAVFSYTGSILLLRGDQTRGHGNALVSPFEGNLKIECITLDDYAIGKKLFPDFIKIDVEGAEMHVLKGCVRIIELNKPIILCEVHDKSNFAFIIDWAKNNRYILQQLINEDSLQSNEEKFIFPVHVLLKPE